MITRLKTVIKIQSVGLNGAFGNVYVLNMYAQVILQEAVGIMDEAIQ